MRPVSKRKQITTISTYQTNSYFVFALYLLHSNFSMAKPHQRKKIEPSKQEHNAKKTESVKTEQSVAI